MMYNETIPLFPSFRWEVNLLNKTIEFENSFKDILGYFEEKLEECQKGFSNDNIKMRALPSDGGLLPTAENLRYGNWTRFEKRLKHFFKIYHALNSDDMNRKLIQQLKNEIPDSSKGSKERYTTKIVDFLDTLRGIFGEKQIIKKFTEKFEKDLNSAMQGDSIPMHLLMLKTIIATPEDCLVYVFRLMRGGITTFTPPQGFLKEEVMTVDFSKILSELMTIGFDPNYCDADNRTALHGAIMKQNEDAAVALIENTVCNLNTADKFGRTPLIYAAEFGLLKVVKALLRSDRKIAFDAKTLDGKKALDIAQDKGFEDIIKELFNHKDGISKTVKRNFFQNLKVEDKVEYLDLKDSVKEKEEKEIENIAAKADVKIESTVELQCKEIKSIIDTETSVLKQNYNELKQNYNEIKEDVAELQEILQEPIAFHHEYKNAKLTYRQKMFYDLLHSNFSRLFKDLQTSPLRALDSTPVLGVESIKNKSTKKENIKSDVMDKLDKGSKTTDKADRILDSLFQSEDLHLFLEDASKFLVVTHVITSLVSNRLKKRRETHAKISTGKALDWFGKHSPQTIDFFVQYLALELTKHLGQTLELIKFIDYEAFALCTVRRLASFIFTESFTYDDEIPDICKKICNFHAEQDKFFLNLIPCVKVIQLDSNSMKAKFTQGKAKEMPIDIDENILQQGYEACKKHFEELGLESIDSPNIPPQLPLDELPHRNQAASRARSLNIEAELRNEIAILHLKNNGLQKQVTGMQKQLSKQQKQIDELFRLKGQSPRKVKVNPVSLSPDTKILSKAYIAENLWQNKHVNISDNIFEKVKVAQKYLDSQGYELVGTPSDGNCFFHAFLGSYQDLVTSASDVWSLPQLDMQDNKIQYLRDCIAEQYKKAHIEENRAEKIRVNGKWIEMCNEGDILAKSFGIPIRCLTVNEENQKCNCIDLVTDKNGETQVWKTIPEDQKPQKHVFIVDLGGHFIFANKKI